MRVSMKRGSFPSPCETLPFGEVQDYSVNFSMSNAAVLPGSFVSPEARGTKPSPDVRFWPNPTAGKLFFQPKIEMAGEVFLEIFTVQGKPVFFQKYFSDGKTVIDLDVFGLENGVYFLRARGDGFRNFTEKMVVENGN